jgi:hypothetical protein
LRGEVALGGRSDMARMTIYKFFVEFILMFEGIFGGIPLKISIEFPPFVIIQLVVGVFLLLYFATESIVDVYTKQTHH